MSQKAFLRDFDAQLMSAFKGAGMADAAIYTAPGGGAALPCDVYVDRGISQFADDAIPVPAQAIVITLFRAQVSPVIGGSVVVDGDTFILDAKIDEDESRQRWVVQA